MAKVETSDNIEFPVSDQIVNLCEVLKNLVADIDVSTASIQLPTISSHCWTKFAKAVETVVIANDKAYVESLGNLDILELVLTSNYLNCPSLTKRLAAKMARRMKGKTPQQLREMFGIENDLTPEDEAEIREKNQWIFKPVKEEA